MKHIEVRYFISIKNAPGFDYFEPYEPYEYESLDEAKEGLNTARKQYPIGYDLRLFKRIFVELPY